MKKLYEKSEIWFAVICIVVYVMVMGNVQSNFGIGSIWSVVALLVITGIILAFVFKNGLGAKYGFLKIQNSKKFLFFIPLVLIATVNLWFGVTLHYDVPHQILAFIAMALSGLAEELIFRGLLFRAMEKSNVKAAIIVSSVTFGIGHIVNLFTGAATLETFLQMLYAIAIGFAFVYVFYKGKSIIPCILTHSVINMTAEISREGSMVWMYIQVVFLIVVASGYALYLRKK